MDSHTSPSRLVREPFLVLCIHLGEVLHIRQEDL